MEKPTEFDYLLNRMEHAAQQSEPAQHHYGTHRASLMRHVRALEKDAERYRRLRDANPAALLAVAWGNSKAACAIGADCDAAIDAWAAEAGGSVSAQRAG